LKKQLNVEIKTKSKSKPGLLVPKSTSRSTGSSQSKIGLPTAKRVVKHTKGKAEKEEEEDKDEEDKDEEEEDKDEEKEESEEEKDDKGHKEDKEDKEEVSFFVRWRSEYQADEITGRSRQSRSSESPIIGNRGR